MWRMAGAPAAAPSTGWPPPRRRAWSCRTSPSGGSPSSTAPTRTSRCRRSPCRGTRPSPARGQYHTFNARGPLPLLLLSPPCRRPPGVMLRPCPRGWRVPLWGRSRRAGGRTLLYRGL
ncbi:hypothetical protein ONE63_000357 [Megalurothrips usitatus]|uniref:Uncharacterized protein n=1 Tax=Megalurothrips usitatus TaxID=439358 RepID=A0AAV7XY68_9NEOP|nr:hypothetical protein ONE63_000357 [Megalurothrips usitatus]